MKWRFLSNQLILLRQIHGYAEEDEARCAKGDEDERHEGTIGIEVVWNHGMLDFGLDPR